MFTIATFFMGVLFGIPYWMIALAMLLDTALLISGVEHIR